MALGTVHYYAYLPEELKPDFGPNQHSHVFILDAHLLPNS